MLSSLSELLLQASLERGYHPLGFRFAPRICDLADRRLYVANGSGTAAALAPMIGGAVDFRVGGENWDETLGLAASIKAGARRSVGVDAAARGLAAWDRRRNISATPPPKQ
jgi:hypothetical protein